MQLGIILEIYLNEAICTLKEQFIIFFYNLYIYIIICQMYKFSL